MLVPTAEEKEEKSNLKNSNPKIGRPAKTDQEEQFKNHYMENRKKFELECELLVYIHQIFFEEIPTHPTNAKIDVSEIVRLFEVYDCMELYRILAKLNELYYKSSSLFPEEKLRYTSLIDVSYLMRQVKIERGDALNSYELVLLVLFFL
jgi:hypothetical protein